MQGLIEIPVQPPKSSFMDVTRPLRIARNGVLTEGWAQGDWPEYVTWISECAIPVGTWPRCVRVVDCNGGSFIEDPKPVGNPPPFAVAIPFWITAGETCDSFGALTAGQHRDRVTRAIEARQSKQLARILQTGMVNGAEQCINIAGTAYIGISLQNTAVVSSPLVAGGVIPADGYQAVGIQLAIAGLLRDMEDCDSTGEYTFHMPIELLPFLAGDDLVRQGDHWLLYGEYPVIFSGGYDGQPPIVPPPDGPIPPPGPGEAWIYVTGPVYRAVSDWTVVRGVDGDGDQYGGDSFDAAVQNIIEARAEKLAVVAFDPCCVFAGLVKYCA